MKKEENFFPAQLLGILGCNSLENAQEQLASAQEMMARYRCAIMEVETKFRVLDEQLSLQKERNPI